MRKVPMGVRVVAAIDVGLGLLLALRGLGQIASAILRLSPLGILSGALQVILALPIAIIGAGLWLGARWARTLRIGWAGVAVAANVAGWLLVGEVPGGFVALVFSASVLVYLAWSEEAKRSFD